MRSTGFAPACLILAGERNWAISGSLNMLSFLISVCLLLCFLRCHVLLWQSACPHTQTIFPVLWKSRLHLQLSVHPRSFKPSDQCRSSPAFRMEWDVVYRDHDNILYHVYLVILHLAPLWTVDLSRKEDVSCSYNSCSCYAYLQSGIVIHLELMFAKCFWTHEWNSFCTNRYRNNEPYLNI